MQFQLPQFHCLRSYSQYAAKLVLHCIWPIAQKACAAGTWQCKDGQNRSLLRPCMAPVRPIDPLADSSQKSATKRSVLYHPPGTKEHSKTARVRNAATPASKDLLRHNSLPCRLSGKSRAQAKRHLPLHLTSCSFISAILWQFSSLQAQGGFEVRSCCDTKQAYQVFLQTSNFSTSRTQSWLSFCGSAKWLDALLLHAPNWSSPGDFTELSEGPWIRSKNDF